MFKGRTGQLKPTRGSYISLRTRLSVVRVCVCVCVCMCVCVCIPNSGEGEMNKLEGRYLQTISYRESTVE